MSTTTTPQATADTSDEPVDAATAREQKIEAQTRKLYQALQRAEQRKPPEERTKNGALWTQARRQATRDYRRTAVKDRTKQTARSVATSAYAESKSTLHRNRRQLAPWLLTTPYAATGEAAWLLSEFGSGNPVAISATAALSTAGASILAWRKKLSKRTPGQFRAKVQAGLGMLCGWTSTMPLVDGSTGQAGMWLALAAGTSYMGLSWWREHDHPIPISPGNMPTPAPVEAPEPVAESPATRRINGILHAWRTKIAASEKGAVPRSSLEHVSSTDAVDKYRITLDDEGQVTRKQVRNLQERIALALGVLEEDLSFENTDHPAVLIMRHLVGTPVTDYAGPVVLCDGQPIHSRWEITPGSTVDIVYGYYTDGDDQATYRIIDAGSVNSMFVLGGTGSGKTRLLEIIAIALRFIGCRIWYVDGQDGASSGLLNEHADWVVPFTQDGVGRLASAVNGVCEDRNAELRSRPELNNEYSYDPARPPVIVIMEEAHAVFCMKRDKNGTYGQVFGRHGVQIRKDGVGFVAASQDIDKTDTFGNSARLRQSLLATNNFAAMRLVDKSRIGMLPSACPKLDTVPPKGFGFSPFSDRPDALWRTPNIDGGDYSKASWMAAYDPAPVVTVSTAPVPESENEEQGEPTSPAQGRVVHFPGSTRPVASQQHSPAVGATTVDASSLTSAEQRTLDLLAAEPGHTPTSLAHALDISRQGAGKHLRSLAAKGHVAQADDGSYTTAG